MLRVRCKSSTASEVDDCWTTKHFAASSATFHQHHQYHYSACTCPHDVSSGSQEISKLTCPHHFVSATLVVNSGRAAEATAAACGQEARAGECRGGSQWDALVDGRREGRCCRSHTRHHCDAADARLRRLSLPTPAQNLTSTSSLTCRWWLSRRWLPRQRHVPVITCLPVGGWLHSLSFTLHNSQRVNESEFVDMLDVFLTTLHLG